MTAADSALNSICYTLQKVEVLQWYLQYLLFLAVQFYRNSIF